MDTIVLYWMNAPSGLQENKEQLMELQLELQNSLEAKQLLEAANNEIRSLQRYSILSFVYSLTLEAHTKRLKQALRETKMPSSA